MAVNAETLPAATARILEDVKVLALDDEASVRVLLTDCLSRHGAIVETVASGRAGLQALMEEDYDVVVVDVRMQGMDGPTFVQEARKIWPWLGVVAVTAYPPKDISDRLQKLGVERLLCKPFSPEELATVIRQEYESCQQQFATRDRVTLQSIQHQLRNLRLLTEPALHAETMIEALRRLTLGLASCLPFAVVGVLAKEEEFVSIFNVQEHIGPEFLATVQSDMYARYEALSGHKLPPSIRVQHEGLACDPGGPQEAGSTFSVPIINAGDVQGVLLIAAAQRNAYSTADISFIHHVANHMSTVFLALSRMRDLAIHDPLTSVYNRLHIEAEFQSMWQRSQRYHRPLAVVIMDIDHFKTINDSYGHLVGDEVLREFAELLKKTARSTDILGRYGGEEFVVILPEGDRSDGIACAERLLREVRNYVFLGGTHRLYMTISLGLAVFDPDASTQKNSQELLAEADSAMYMAKRSGRNCLRVWSDVARRSLSDGERPKPPAKGNGGDARVIVQAVAGKILVVDDDSAIRQLLQVMLQRDGYDVTAVESGQEALEAVKLELGEYDVVLADLQMPGISGIDLLKKLQSLDESIISIIVSGHATVNNAIKSLRYGAYDFIQKPFVYKQLSAVMKRALSYRVAIQENKQYQRHLSDMVRQKSAKLRESLEAIKRSYEFTLEAFVGLLDAREPDVGDHSKRVRALTAILAKRVAVPDDELEAIDHGVLLHDIGKIGIPDSILLKPGKLTEAEWVIMKRHAEIGYRILSSSSYLSRAAEIVYSHQEHFDGSGYPRGLSGTDICLGARIFSIIDAYDAMRSNRVYRKALSVEHAVGEIRTKSGSQFDPELVAAFLECHAEIETTFKALSKPL